MRTTPLGDYKRRLLRVLVHIQEHLDEALSLEELAGLACFSPFHFHRIFKGMVGETLREHVRRLRLERAASRLKRGAQPVTSIALDAGYGSHEAFTRSFHDRFGCSPSQYRSARRLETGRRAGSGVRFVEGQRVANFRTVPIRREPLDVVIKKVKPTRLAFMRHIGPYRTVGKTWDRLLPVLGKEGLLGSLFVGICLDDPDVTPASRIRYDACVGIDENYRPEREIGVQTLSGGIYARTTHAGPYEGIGLTYSKLLGQWLPRSGVELRPVPCFEVYLNDPQSTEKADLITDIYAPLDRVPRHAKLDREGNL
jgi:AraC family transcriptional regulator